MEEHIAELIALEEQLESNLTPVGKERLEWLKSQMENETIQ